MNVFKYWSRAWCDSAQEHDLNFKLCRLAGSNISLEDAQFKAQQRLSESIERLKSGAALKEYEYQSKDLKEELIEEVMAPNGERVAAITRNRYGALVLNTQKILFADIDAENREPTFYERFLQLIGKGSQIKDKAYYLQKIELFAKQQTDFELLVYETFAGFRVAVISHEFAAIDSKAQMILEGLGSDPLYIKLCQQQDCFRARLSPKPWRCGSPKPNCYFPLESEQQIKAMQQWQQHYDERSAHYKVCNKAKHLNQQLGQNESRKLIERIIRVHDAYVLGSAELPLA